MGNNLARKRIIGIDGRQDRLECRPFLKWVGGKTQLLPELLKRLPPRYTRYVEPFVGGGALLFQLQPRSALIVDTNAELINAYETVRDDVDGLIEELKKYRYNKRQFYRVRNIDRSSAFDGLTPVARAARLIYLNKTCFNGLYRVNSKGQFNSPFGRYTNPRIVDSDNLRAVSEFLQRVEIHSGSFERIDQVVARGDFVYFDPPYVPLSATSSFVSYTGRGFGSEAQSDLAELCRRLDKRGVKFMLSNSSAPLVEELYKGFLIEKVYATRAVNSRSDRRGKVTELIVRNYK